uniref:Uncharacterized protein n=1 Tax=Arundo donax TaxID=35708 RepID=A0A0A9SDU5_ARUDO
MTTRSCEYPASPTRVGVFVSSFRSVVAACRCDIPLFSLVN